MDDIQDNIRSCDIVREIFSVFTSRCVWSACHLSRGESTCVRRYDEIRTVQAVHLMSVWVSGGEKSRTLHENLDEKLDSYAAGELGHAVEAVSLIWDLSRGRVALPSVPQSPRNNEFQFTSCKPPLVDLRTSLVESIQWGSLLHRKYWARGSRGGAVYPIYFPSTMSDSTLSQVAACEWNHILEVTSLLNWAVIQWNKGGDGYLDEGEEFEFSEDSDCESESELAGKPISGSSDLGREKRGQELLPVLKIGSLVSYARCSPGFFPY